MSGLIFGAAMKGVGDGVSSLGSSALQIQSASEAAEAKLAGQREMQRERLDNQRAIAEMRSGGSGGGKDGPLMERVEPGSMAEEMMANRMGMSVPELRKLLEANRSGDTSGLGGTVELPGPTEDGNALTGKSGVSGDWLKAKRAALADIQSEFLYGGKYDDVAKGRRTEAGNKVAGGIIAGAIEPGAGAKAIAATEGKGAYKEGGGVVYDEFEGGSKATSVGESTIRKNDAGAADDRSKAKQRESGQDPERLKLITDLTARERTLRTQMGRMASDPIIANDIKKGRAPQAYLEMQDELSGVLEQRKSLQIGNVKEKSDNSGASAPQAPDISKVSGAPAGSKIGKYDASKGWAVLGKDGKVIGYVRK